MGLFPFSQTNDQPEVVEEVSFEDFNSSLQDLNQVLQERDMAQAYIAVTDQMGPCPQLIAFVNYDNSLGTESGIGLESFAEMDFLQQHELILSKIDIDAMDSMATEAFRDTVIKYRKWLIVGGLFVPFVGWPMIGAGIAGIVMNKKDKASAPPVKLFTALTKCFTDTSRVNTTMTAAIPSTMDETAWKKFSEGDFDKTMESAEQELTTARQADGNHDVPLASSGWTVESYYNAMVWLKENSEKFNEDEKKRAAKLDAIDKKLDSGDSKATAVTKYVSAMLTQTSKSSHTCLAILNEIKTVLSKTGRHFEVKAK